MLDPNAAIMSWEQADQIIQDQRAEIARLTEAIRRLAAQDATLSACCGKVIVQIDAPITDKEREAIIAGEDALADWALEVVSVARKAFFESHAATLRGLLKKLGDNQCTS
ncbi:hypothetical protein EBZ39_01550 [bacterium]|nr:hypothetical protein [bacterium]